MTTYKQRPLKRKRRVSKPRPLIRLNRFSIEPLGAGSGYEVEIEGFNLYGTSPCITVGNIPLGQLEYQPGGRGIRGVLPRMPRSRRFVVDFGYAYAEIEEEEHLSILRKVLLLLSQRLIQPFFK